MLPRWRAFVVAVLLVLGVPLIVVGRAGAATGPPGPLGALGGAGARHHHRDACRPAASGHARCFAKIVTSPDGAVPFSATPRGYSPDDLHRAYAMPGQPASGVPTVAIVDSYDDPNAEADLAAYRQYYSLPPCGSSDGCFRKVNQRGGTNPPPPDGSWAAEIALDLDVVSAACPACRILLIEADTSRLTDLAKAVDLAATMGATAISNSYGDAETPADVDLDPSYDHPGIAITAAAGDGGFGVNFPAASEHVTAVGGTSLVRADNARGWTESVWPNDSSGCSTVFPKPSWQTDGGCQGRTVADVAAMADPENGVAVYSTYGVSGGPWLTMGGTSAAAPLVASAYVLSGHAGAATYAAVTMAFLPYANAAHGGGGLSDVTSGSNGSCRPSYLCVAGPGYDGPTGLGTPNGLAAF